MNEESLIPVGRRNGGAGRVLLGLLIGTLLFPFYSFFSPFAAENKNSLFLLDARCVGNVDANVAAGAPSSPAALRPPSMESSSWGEWKKNPLLKGGSESDGGFQTLR